MWFNDGDYWYLCDKCGVKLKHNECVVVCVGQETVAECCKPCAEVIRGEIAAVIKIFGK